MKINPVIAAAAVSGACIFILPLLTKRRSVKTRYQKMNERELFVTNIHAKIMKQALHIAAYIGSVPLLILISIPSMSGYKDLLTCIVLIMFPASIALSLFFRQIFVITATELEHRKIQKKKTPKTEQ